jgi:flavodoxin
MTRALVVYESMFGNTEAVARAVADGLAERLLVETVEVTDAPARVTADLLVVGGPTHAFGMSRAKTRADAVRQGSRAGRQMPAAGVGIREWIDATAFAPGTVVATFDTKLHASPGSAAGAALRRLRARGLHVADRAQRFYVRGTPGPLLDGELDRARGWGRTLARRLAAAPARVR